MLPRIFAGMLFWDKVLVVLFVLFSVFLITSLVIITAPERRRKLERLLTKWVIRMTKRKRNEQAETVTPLKGAAYELQRKHWEMQLQPKKIRREKNRETKKDKEEL